MNKKQEKNWTGNSNSIYKTLGASNHTTKDREKNDYYATEPAAIKLLLEQEDFNEKIWEPAAGELHISKVLEEYGYDVLSTDIIERGEDLDYTYNFLINSNDLLNDNIVDSWEGDIITNPPYKYAQDFVERGMELLFEGNKLALFLKLQFLEGKKRKKMFKKYPPKVVYVSSSRLLCAKNANFKKMRDGGGSAVAYAWFVWVKGFKGGPIIKWIN